jgi:hypothetical protein
MSLRSFMLFSTLWVGCLRCNAGGNDAGAIHSVAYSHGDLGYGNYPHVLRTENRLENLFRAIQYCEETAGWPTESQYRWQQEMAEPLPLFLGNCTPEQAAKLARYIREGRISIAATHATVLADRLNPESAARLFYLGGRLIPDLLETPPARIAIINDVIGVPWSLPIYCEAAGVPFLSLGHNTCGRCVEMESAPIVRWTGPAGTGTVLAFGSVYNYHAVNKPAKELPGAVAADAGRITPNYLPVWLQGHDFSTTTMDMANAAKQWNVTGTPKVQMSTLEMYLDALSTRQTTEKTPAVSKTGPCQWMDQPISNARLFGRTRRAAERLSTAEKFSSVAMVAASGGYPWFDFTIGWHNLLSGFEHTCGAACWRCKDTEGWRHYETEQVEHEEEGAVAASAADHTLNSALARLAAQIAATNADTIAVFNPLAQPRTDIVSIQPAEALAGKALLAVDDTTGSASPCQWFDEKNLLFTAAEVPALGYRTFHLVQDKTPRPDNLNRMTNRFYEVRLDPITRCIASLVDKELNRELVSTNCAHAFAQYLYQWYDAPKGKPANWSQPPEDAHVTVDGGPVATVLRIRSKAEGVEWLEQTIFIYQAIKRIDFELRMDKKPSGRTLADYNANNLRGKESVFIALPFDIPGFKAVYQTGGGGVAEPVRDQFTGTGTAFYTAQHFADLSNDKFGVTVSPLDCALVEFDHPRSDALTRTRPEGEKYFEKKMEYPQRSFLYLYLLDNMFTTNIRVDQRGEQLFRWSIRSHAGGWQEGEADRFGEAVNQPLLACRIKPQAGGLPAGARSFVSVSAPNVSISTIKLAEWNGDGFIVRMNETAGRTTDAVLKLPFFGPLTDASETTLTETDLGRPLQLADQAIAVSLPPYGVKTLRVRAAVPAGIAVTGLHATAQSDMEVSLRWDPVAGAAFYRVYRDTSANFTPSPMTLVSMPDECRHLDKAQNHTPAWMANRLAPGTTYYYRVEAVNRYNSRGPACASVAVTTLPTAQKACPPVAVQGLHAILVSPLAPANRINLLWRSNVEPNIGGYEIHRSMSSGYTPSTQTLLAKHDVQTSARASVFKGFDHQMYLDANAASGTTFYYRVRAVTKEGLPGEFSGEAAVTTKKDNAPGPSVAKASGKELLGNDGKQE